MAGVDYQEWGLSIEEWELQESVVPPHLLADDSEEEDYNRDNIDDSEGEVHHRDDDARVFNGLTVRQAVSCDIRASVGKLMTGRFISHIMIVCLKQLKFLTLLLENFLFSHIFKFLL